jgi:hypothetical protein
LSALSVFNDNFFHPELARRPGSAQNARTIHIFMPGAKFGCFRFLVGLKKSGRAIAMKMTRAIWSVVVPVLVIAGLLSLSVIFVLLLMIFIGIGPDSL